MQQNRRILPRSTRITVCSYAVLILYLFYTYGVPLVLKNTSVKFSFACLIVPDDTLEFWSDDDDQDDTETAAVFNSESDLLGMDPESPPSVLEQDVDSASSGDTSSKALVRWLLVFFLLLHVKFHLSDHLLKVILQFLKIFFTVLGRLHTSYSAIGHELAATYYSAQRCYTAAQKFHIVTYPVCKRCGSVWKFNDCIDGYGINRKAKLCPFSDPLNRRHHQCNAVLLKTVELATNRRIFYPLMTYCYIDLCTSMQNLLHSSELIGIIPGPSEPQLTVNSYLDPLIADLLKLWDGIQLEVKKDSHSESKLVCGDLPAGRKLVGFFGHSAHLGCSKCKKYFPSTEHGLDYSGFDRENWIYRTNQSHREDVDKLSECQSKTELQQKQKMFGCRYSALLRLPYFDAPTMLVIDPMHNLFLGVAKHFLKNILIGQNILTDEHLQIIQERADRLSVPPDIGRIPNKIKTSFGGFTADQYKNWVIHYSIICFQGILSPEHMECW